MSEKTPDRPRLPVCLCGHLKLNHEATCFGLWNDCQVEDCDCDTYEEDPEPDR